MRYPTGENAWAHAANDQHTVGYHDDSFAWATLNTGKAGDDWFFGPAMKSAGKKALNKWKNYPIGGEIRPEVWGCVFDDNSCVLQGQEFDQCVGRLHVTWLIDSGMFAYADPPPTKKRIANATKAVQKLGYELFASKAVINNTGGSASVAVTVENTGVAPFYYDWPVELVALNSKDEVITSIKLDCKLTSLVPDEKPQTWSGEIQLGRGRVAKLAIRVRNPMDGGKPLRFANQTQADNGLLILQ